MVEALSLKFLHILHQFPSIHFRRIKQLSFPPIQIAFYSVLILFGEFQHGWVAGTGSGQVGGFKQKDVGMYQSKLWTNLVFKIKGNYSGRLYSTPQSCAALQYDSIFFVVKEKETQVKDEIEAKNAGIRSDETTLFVRHLQLFQGSETVATLIQYSV